MDYSFDSQIEEDFELNYIFDDDDGLSSGTEEEFDDYDSATFEYKSVSDCPISEEDKSCIEESWVQFRIVFVKIFVEKQFILATFKILENFRENLLLGGKIIPIDNCPEI